jgi:hypothetical protein
VDWPTSVACAPEAAEQGVLRAHNRIQVTAKRASPDALLLLSFPSGGAARCGANRVAGKTTLVELAGA